MILLPLPTYRVHGEQEIKRRDKRIMEEPSNVIFCKHIHIIPGSVIGTVILSPEVNFGKYIIFCKVKDENSQERERPPHP